MHKGLLCLLAAGLLAANPPIQGLQKTVSSGASPAERGIRLAEKGRCDEALALLKKSLPLIHGKDLKYHAAMAAARCAMSLDSSVTVVNTLLLLNREFPNDPEVLYVTTHYYSELASRASQKLASIAPSSYQAEKLEAEADESQGKWDEATAVYNKILGQNPKLPEIHYRLGRILLSQPSTAAGNEDARKQFQAELKIDPENASAEFMLGELARQAGNWDEAIGHFSKASKLDEGFSDALLALGVSFNSAGKFSDATAPLEKYVQMEPSDPAGHYQLGIAYSRTGKKDLAAQQMTLQRETAEKAPRTAQDSSVSH